MLPCNKCGKYYVVKSKNYHRGWCPKCSEKELAQSRDKKRTLGVQGVQGVQTCTVPSESMPD